MSAKPEIGQDATTTLDAADVPQWWKEVFPAGPSNGFFRREHDQVIRFTERNPSTLFISVELLPVRDDAALSDRVTDTLCIDRGWSQLVLQVTQDGREIDRLERIISGLAEEGLFKPYGALKLLGAGKAGSLILRLGGVLTKAQKVAICPDSIPSNWPADAAPVDLFYDPLAGPRPSAGSLPTGSVMLRLPGLSDDPVASLQDAGLLETAMGGCFDRSLKAADFHTRIRARKRLPLYRETLHRLSRARQTARAKERWPRTRGNVWMLENRGGSLHYLSDQWGGRVIGFEERHGVTLAQTPPTMRGVIALGDWCGIPRPLPERFPWHVLDETLSGHGPDFAARAHGALLANHLDSRGTALPGVLALDLPQAGSTLSDFAADSTLRRKLRERLAQANEAALSHDRTVHVDRVILGLGSGAADADEAEITATYRDLIGWLEEAIPQNTGQGTLPYFVLSQSAGSRTNGRAPRILAEGRLEASYPAGRVVVAGPAYPYALMPDMPSTPDPAERLLMDELEALAVATCQSGGRWFCPELRLATWSGTEITAAFTSLTPLVLDPGPHGFRLEGAPEDLEILSAEQVDDTRIRLTCNRAPDEAGLALAYAWGWSKAARDGYPANHGAVRDSWEAQSLLSPDWTLRRYALAGVVPLMSEDRVGAA